MFLRNPRLDKTRTHFGLSGILWFQDRTAPLVLVSFRLSPALIASRLPRSLCQNLVQPLLMMYSPLCSHVPPSIPAAGLLYLTHLKISSDPVQNYLIHATMHPGKKHSRPYSRRGQG